jgi:hypothetical protein
MKLRRRTMLIAICSAAAGVTVLQTADPIRKALRANRFAKKFDELFGEKLSDTDTGRAFLAQWTAIPRPFTERSFQHMTQDFLRNSNFIAHIETGVPLEFDMIAGPYEAPCNNQLSANWAPDTAS